MIVPELLAFKYGVDAVAQLSLLCMKIYDKYRSVQRFQSDCAKLLEFVQRTQAVLESTQAAADMRDQGWQEAFKGLDAALHDVDQVFEDCSQYGKIKSIMHADDMNSRLNRAASRLQMALAMIPIQQGSVTGEKLAEVRVLQVDLLRAQWEATQQAEQQAAVLRRLAHAQEHDTAHTHELLQQILALLKSDAPRTPVGSSSSNSNAGGSSSGSGAGCSQASAAVVPPGVCVAVQQQQLEAEKRDLKQLLQEWHRDNQVHDEAVLHHIIQLIGVLEATTGGSTPAAAAAGGGQAGGAPGSVQGGSRVSVAPGFPSPCSSPSPPPLEYLCPITLQLFSDPVLLVGSGHTYERRAIEEWLARGNTKDPASGIMLQNTTFSTNHVVRKAAQDWLEKNPWYAATQTEQQQQQQQQFSVHQQQQQQDTAGAHLTNSNNAAASTALSRYPDLTQKLLQLNIGTHTDNQQYTPPAAATAAAAARAGPATQQGPRYPYPPILPLQPVVLEYNNSSDRTQQRDPAALKLTSKQGLGEGAALNPVEQQKLEAQRAYAAAVADTARQEAASGGSFVAAAYAAASPSAPPAPAVSSNNATGTAAAAAAAVEATAAAGTSGAFQQQREQQQPPRAVYTSHSVFERAAAHAAGAGVQDNTASAAAASPVLPLPQPYFLLEKYSAQY